MRDNAIKHDLWVRVKVLEEKAKRSDEAEKMKRALKESQEEAEKVRNAHLELKKGYAIEIEALEKKLESIKVVASDLQQITTTSQPSQITAANKFDVP